MKKKVTFKGIWQVLKDASNGFSNDKIAKLSASLAYYTLFSLGPLLICIILLLVSLAVTALIEALNARMQAAFPHIAVVVFYIINLIITLAVTTLLFGVIFKVLPDAKIKWKDVIAGSIATGVLFMIGKFVI